DWSSDVCSSDLIVMGYRIVYRAPRTITSSWDDRESAQISEHFHSRFDADAAALSAAAILGRLKPTPRSCGGHALESHETTDVVDEVLQSDLGSRSDDADCSYEAATRRALLSAEHVLDTSANPALLSVGVLFR